MASGANLLATGKAMPAKASTVNGQTFNWSRIVFAGGNQVVSGDALFTKFQPIWDHRLVWAGKVARRHAVTYWPAATGIPANTFVKSIIAAPASNQSLLTGGVVNATSLAGFSSKTGKKVPSSQPRHSVVGWSPAAVSSSAKAWSSARAWC